ncbi:hypothetical protein [Falsiroseomonas oryzae]|uniref:hypothetical protein n=1 Tax=Falsiroseomonas oryzae TaxID=2766473 RepID=UPI0022EB8C1E|nr:hypothetical protein [Roseomonas sp. MO-31]
MRIVTQEQAQREPLAYTLRSATLATGLSENTLRRRAAEGRLRLVKIEGRTLVDGDSLRAMIRGAATGQAAA